MPYEPDPYIKTFKEMYDYAVKKKGGKKELEELMHTVKSTRQLKNISDDRFLAQITKSIFQAGFSWKVIESKWEGFEKAFKGFDIDKNARQTNTRLEALVKDKSIVRNRMKIVTVRHNAQMIKDIQKEHGSFAKFIAMWPSDDYIGLLAYLQKNGSRIGGATGQYALRMLGRDGFIIGRDSEAELRFQGVITGGASSKRSLMSIQKAFDDWHTESGRSYADISRILAMQRDA